VSRLNDLPEAPRVAIGIGDRHNSRARRPPECAPSLWRFQQHLKGPEESLAISNCRQHTCHTILDDLGNRVEARTDCRQSGRTRFKENRGKGLAS
jgi:hypothetical protein